jgi:phosphate acetyltransferase
VNPVVQRLRREASALGARVVFPESSDPRVVEAAAILEREGIVKPILLDPSTDPRADDLGRALYDLRKGKGMTEAEARRAILNPLMFGAMLVRTGGADACVAGSLSPTADVIRAALRILGLAPGVSLVSSVFLMALADGRAVTYGDCAVVPYPDAAGLAAIALSSAETHRQLTGERPVVAMLSFSTKGSAEHEAVAKVREATARARAARPDLDIDGELQFDAALVPEVGRRKAPGSAVAGRANVFVFPNLDAGNIAYKITERLGGAQAIGPVIQGLAKPMHDLSRGCQVDDIVTVAAIGALQACGKGDA